MHRGGRLSDLPGEASFYPHSMQLRQAVSNCRLRGIPLLQEEGDGVSSPGGPGLPTGAGRHTPCFLAVFKLSHVCKGEIPFVEALSSTG